MSSANNAAQVVLDTGWFSGTIQTFNIDTSRYDELAVVFAASGAAAPSAVSATPAFGTNRADSPGAVVGNALAGVAYTVATPSIGGNNTYYVGPESGSIAPFVPRRLVVSATPGAASWARVIVDGR